MQNELTYMKETAAYDLTVLASPWSPPGWMKDNGQEKGSGFLLPAHHTDYAQCLARWIAAMLAIGLVAPRVLAGEPVVTTTATGEFSVVWLTLTGAPWAQRSEHHKPAPAQGLSYLVLRDGESPAALPKHNRGGGQSMTDGCL